MGDAVARADRADAISLRTSSAQLSQQAPVRTALLTPPLSLSLPPPFSMCTS
jgi:hypothetical protein